MVADQKNNHDRFNIWPTDEEAKRAFEEYCMAIGKICYAWNYFHERLRDLYMLFSPEGREPASDKWYRTYNDSWQRELLRIEIATLSDWPNLSAHDDVGWLLDQADIVSKHRNNAIHSPCCLYINGGGGDSAVMGPVFMDGHPRAKALEGKTLLFEFEWCERYTETLIDFTKEIESSYGHPDYYPWPTRPILPQRSKTS